MVPITAKASADPEILPCPACGGIDAQPVWKRFRGDTGDRAIACKVCGLVRRARSADDRFDSNEFYTGRYRTEYFAPPKRDFARMIERAAPYQEVRLDRLGPLVRPGVRLLEIGCGPGYFLEAARKRGAATVTGVELDVDQARFGAAHYGIDITTEPVETDRLAAGSWDLICLFQVLEHCADPLRFLAHVRRVLAPGGHLAVEVPDLRNPLVSLYAIESFKSFWYQRPHELYFEATTLSGLLARAGFATQSLRAFQEMGLVNHLNWMVAGTPMRDRASALAGGLPVDRGTTVDPDAFAAVDALFREADARYRQALEDRGFGDILLGVFAPS